DNMDAVKNRYNLEFKDFVSLAKPVSEIGNAQRYRKKYKKYKTISIICFCCIILKTILLLFLFPQIF
ncbi:MAG: hypothetical protein LBN20_03975, partial [Endomicrobium sp.]|nr:hypothetical protein [Endomicrobium sp.]